MDRVKLGRTVPRPTTAAPARGAPKPDSRRPSLRRGRMAALPIMATLFVLGQSSTVLGEEVLARADCAGGSRVAAGRAAAVLDGMTILLGDGREVRLAGIAAPDPADAEAARLGAAAAALLARLVEGRDLLFGEPARGDRYGRTVAQVFLRPGTPAVAELPRSGTADPEWVQAAVVGAGLARVSGTADQRQCLAELLGFERVARAARRGLWQGPRYAPRQATDPSLLAEADIYQLVEGQVLSLGRSRGTIYLNFGRDWSTDFTVVILAADAERFSEAGVDLDGLDGRRVRVRGFLTQRDGPTIRVDHPEQIEILDGE